MNVSVQMDGQDYPIEKGKEVFAIGRQNGNDLQIADKSVSRKHCSILQESKKILIRDNKSKYGTTVNGKKVEDARTLEDGDKIVLAKRINLVITIEEKSEITVVEESSK